MTEISTLLEFLESTGAKVRIYDIGRRVSKISRQNFLRIEKQEKVYPFPLQQQAWFSMSLLDKNVSDEPVIWFLCFPLDETGRLQLASRDYFMHRLFEAAAARQTKSPELSADALKDNPHVFKPRDDKMAIVHARLSVALQQPPSRYYDHSRDYLSGKQGWEQWNFVGFQGIADVIERLEEDDNHSLLLEAIPNLPAPPLQAVCQCLENREIDLSMSERLMARLQQTLTTTGSDSLTAAHLLRALSQSCSQTYIKQAFETTLQHPFGQTEEVLAAIGARCWHWLIEPANMTIFLQKLSALSQENFNHCLSDLMFMPGMRDTALQCIRSPQRSDQLATAFHNMLQR